MKLLEALRFADRSAVFFMSDNGAPDTCEGELESRGLLRGAKRSRHEGGIRLLLIAHLPGVIGAGVVSNQTTYAPEMLPALASAAEFLPDDVNWLSIVPAPLGKTVKQQWHGFLNRVWDQRSPQCAVRHDRWKLMSDNPGVRQVFDLETDISESYDTASERPDLIEKSKTWTELNRTARVGRHWAPQGTA